MRICVAIAEDDLRAWVLEELQLLSWSVRPVIEVVADLAALHPEGMSVLVVDTDRRTAAELERLHARTSSAPIIAIGTSPNLPFEHVLGPGLTSRELARALRATLANPPQTRTATG